MVTKTLKELLEEANIKQVEMAKILRLSESHISLLVNGKRRMSMDIASVFAEKLNTSIDAIFFAVTNTQHKERKDLTNRILN